MEYVIKAAGKEWVTNKEYLYERALTLNDDAGFSLDNERLRFVINHYFLQKSENKPLKRKVDNSIASLHSLSQEMGKVNLSYEDEEWLDDILGSDPYTPLY